MSKVIWDCIGFVFGLSCDWSRKLTPKRELYIWDKTWNLVIPIAPRYCGLLLLRTQNDSPKCVCYNESYSYLLFVCSALYSNHIPTSISGRALKALNRVIVLPLPGGPQSTIGLCSASQVYKRASCRTVSTVGTTTSGAATLCVSTSIWGTLDCHSAHSPWIVTWKGSKSKGD